MKIKKKWNFNINEPVMGISLGYLTNSQEKNILAYTKSGKVLLFLANGKLLYEESVMNNIPIWSGFIEDIDNDNKGELIIGGLDGILRVFKCNDDLNLLSYWTHQFGSSISGILTEDINNDGIKELIAYSLDKSIRVLRPYDGSLIWGQLFEGGVSDAKFCRGINNSDNGIIIASSNDGTIRAFEPFRGELLWFKRFENKVRTISYLRDNHEDYIFCGGDDKKLHFLSLRTKEEIKTIKMLDYIWKSLSYPFNFKNNLLISTYSFVFFDEDTPMNKIEFTSEVMALDCSFNSKWELKKVNAEKVDYIEIFDTKIILIGTTRGELFLINDLDGEILLRINQGSCINDLKYDLNLNLLLTCHDDGNINAFNFFID